MRVLGIESSCDETAVAIYDQHRGLLAHRVHTQEVHQQHGGVVPELASRDHIKKCLPLIELALQDADCPPDQITGVAYTKMPGLIGALMVGASIGRSLAYAWGVPAIGVHHLEAHLMVALLEDPAPEFPFLALLVSGGHTLLVRVVGLGEYEILGQSVDDAAGEAFDKTAKLLGLPYPGGAALAALAQQGRPGQFVFPRPMVNRPGLDFSFSGLKTHAWQCVQANNIADQQVRADIAYAFQEAVVDTLRIKCERALRETGLSRLVIVGGVGANQALRTRLRALGDDLNVNVFYPRLEFCTDNGAMVAYTGYLRLQRGEQDGLSLGVKARGEMGV